MFYDLVKIKSFEFSEFDDPISFALYTNEDLSKEKLPGLDYLEKTDKLKRAINKKIEISKPTIIYCILFLILGIINFLL